MKIVTSAQDLPLGCAFIPTMGALHDGHGSLFTIGKSLSKDVVASIFINPLQFEKSEDLEKYPRTPDRDIDLAEKFGVTHLWLPTQQEIYPKGYKTLSAGSLGNVYEGASRPGHFDGVVTVVRRLFDLVKPKFAIFGEKDFQQLTLIKKVKSGVEIIAAPTIRESDGLALSSRNIRLDSDARKSATVISRALFAATREESVESAQACLLEILGEEDAFTCDYAEIIDENEFTRATDFTLDARAIIAGWINGIRLIDNMSMKQGVHS
jgi:pantoate--beta-alanine ligase